MARILIIDDDPDFLEDAADELHFNHFVTDTAATYTEAMTLIEQKSYAALSIDIMIGIKPTEDLDRERAGYGVDTGMIIYERALEQYHADRLVICTIIPDSVRPRLRSGTLLLEKPVSVEAYVSAMRRAAQVP